MAGDNENTTNKKQKREKDLLKPGKKNKSETIITASNAHRKIYNKRRTDQYSTEDLQLKRIIDQFKIILKNKDHHAIMDYWNNQVCLRLWVTGKPCRITQVDSIKLNCFHVLKDLFDQILESENDELTLLMFNLSHKLKAWLLGQTVKLEEDDVGHTITEEEICIYLDKFLKKHYASLTQDLISSPYVDYIISHTTKSCTYMSLARSIRNYLPTYWQKFLSITVSTKPAFMQEFYCEMFSKNTHLLDKTTQNKVYDWYSGKEFLSGGFRISRSITLEELIFEFEINLYNQNSELSLRMWHDLPQLKERYSGEEISDEDWLSGFIAALESQIEEIIRDFAKMIRFYRILQRMTENECSQIATFINTKAPFLSEELIALINLSKENFLIQPANESTHHIPSTVQTSEQANVPFISTEPFYSEQAPVTLFQFPGSEMEEQQCNLNLDSVFENSIK